MKRSQFSSGILAAMLVFSIAVIGCGPDPDGGGTAPTITTTTLPNGEVGTAYSQTLTATGDTPTWTVDTGDLPEGLDLSTAGEISGDPTTAGIFNFTVKAENATGDDTQELSIFVAPSGGGDIVINIAAIAGVTAPAYGGTPVTAITANDQYTGVVAWHDPENTIFTTFAYDTVYTATITLTPKTHYTLEGVNADFFTVTGTTSISNAANSGVITAVFPQTEEDPSLLHLEGNITISPNTDVFTGTELTATYSGSEAVTYQWEKNGTDIENETSETYTPIETGSYTVTVSLAGYNSKTSNAVTVFPLFTDITSFASYVATLANNTAATPYTIKLNVNSLPNGGSSSGNYSDLQKALIDNLSKYVSLDLSGSTFTTIGFYAFKDCRNLTSITIPEGVTTIGTQAFDGCSSLASITIPNSASSISNHAFMNCTGLESIIIPDGVTSIETATFSGCTSLESIIIPDSVTTIEGWAFDHCNSLASVTIPDNVTTIGQQAFYVCNSLASVTIGSSVTTIGNNAFMNCTSLESITIPDSVTTIGNNAFQSCYSLTSVTIGNSVTTIEQSTFSGCTSLTSVIIPDSVITIGNNAFAECYDLVSITLGNSVTTIGNNTFTMCLSLAGVTMPNSVTSIGGYAFYGCSSLTSVTFEDVITSVNFDANAFYGDLRAKFYATDADNGTPGTYTTTAPVSSDSVWTKQP